MTQNAAALELLPCPFCGSTALELGNLVDEDDFFVHCNGCDVQQIANYTKADAIRRWNTRHIAEVERAALGVVDVRPFCPRCNGFGTLVRVLNGNFISGRRDTCEVCHGTGRVAEAEEKR
jgi:Lar family restriction alleviation protein